MVPGAGGWIARSLRSMEAVIEFSSWVVSQRSSEAPLFAPVDHPGPRARVEAEASGVVSRLAETRSQAEETGMSSPETATLSRLTLATITAAARAMYPHDALPDEVYARVGTRLAEDPETA